MKKIIKESKNMKFLVALGPIAISKSVWSQLLDENEKGRSVTSFQDVSLDGNHGLSPSKQRLSFGRRKPHIKIRNSAINKTKE